MLLARAHPISVFDDTLSSIRTRHSALSRGFDRRQVLLFGGVGPTLSRLRP